MRDQLSILERIYNLFETETRGVDVACGNPCPSCCTVNVTATSLETALIFARLDDNEISEMIRRIEVHRPGRCFRPRLTLNGFARACISGQEVEEEENDPSWGACPLLVNGLCSIYRVRPLGCRVMMSQSRCDLSGQAFMPPLVLTLSNIITQMVEQLDQNGISGNFSEMVAAHGKEHGKFSHIFIKNEPVPALMVPPEHQAAAAPFIRKIRAALTGTQEL